MRILVTVLFSTLVGTCAFAQSALIERPLYRAMVKGNKPTVHGYALFGTLPNGQPAITKSPRGHAYFLERSLLFNADMNVLVAWGLECKTGTRYIMAMGPLERMTAVAQEEMIDIKKSDPENLPTLRRICDEVDLPRGKW